MASSSDMLTVADLDPASRAVAGELTRLLTGEEPTGEEPLLALFEGAVERLSNSR